MPLGEIVAGGAIGGIVGAATTWLGMRLQQSSDRQALAQACLVELETLHDEDQATIDGLYRPMLEMWQSTGTVTNHSLLARAFAEDPAARFPVYYASVAELGKLPRATAAELMRYHALRQGLMGLASRIVLAEEMHPDEVKAVAYSARQPFERMVEAKAEAIRLLRDAAKD